jgi:hypothetical protein
VNGTAARGRLGAEREEREREKREEGKREERRKKGSHNGLSSD